MVHGDLRNLSGIVSTVSQDLHLQPHCSLRFLPESLTVLEMIKLVLSMVEDKWTL
jgi:hypothetical protein